MDEIITIKAISWTESNILGLFVSLSNLKLEYNRINFCFYISPKIERSINSIYLLFKSLNFYNVKIFKIKSLVYYLTIFNFSEYIQSFINKKNFITLLPSPMNPPSTLFVPGLIYFYGDGFGSEPKQDYSWFPSKRNLGFKQYLRYSFLKYSNFISYTFNRKAKFIDISLDFLIKRNKIRNYELINIIDIYVKYICQKEKDHLKNIIYNNKFSVEKDILKINNKSKVQKLSYHLVIVSMLSPSRVSFENELNLYKEFFNKINKNNYQNNIFLIKFHIHHTNLFKDKFIKYFKNHNLNIVDLNINIPAEIITLFLIKIFNKNNIFIYTFQESSCKIKLLLEYFNSKINLNFGFPINLIDKYFLKTEISKRKEYQEKILKNLNNIK